MDVNQSSFLISVLHIGYLTKRLHWAMTIYIRHKDQSCVMSVHTYIHMYVHFQSTDGDGSGTQQTLVGGLKSIKDFIFDEILNSIIIIMANNTVATVADSATSTSDGLDKSELLALLHQRDNDLKIANEKFQALKISNSTLERQFDEMMHRYADLKKSNDELSASLLNILWGHCSQNDPELINIPSLENHSGISFCFCPYPPSFAFRYHRNGSTHR